MGRDFSLVSRVEKTFHTAPALPDAREITVLEHRACRKMPMLSKKTFQAKISKSDRYPNFSPAFNMAIVSEMAPLMGDFQINPGGINGPAAHSYNVSPPVQFIHYSVNHSGPADMDTWEDVIYPGDL